RERKFSRVVASGVGYAGCDVRGEGSGNDPSPCLASAFRSGLVSGKVLSRKRNLFGSDTRWNFHPGVKFTLSRFGRTHPCVSPSVAPSLGRPRSPLKAANELDRMETASTESRSRSRGRLREKSGDPR